MVIPQTLVGPVMVDGGVLPLTVKVVPGMLPQALTAETFIEPITKVFAMLTETEFVPAPAVMVIPVGIVQV